MVQTNVWGMPEIAPFSLFKKKIECATFSPQQCHGFDLMSFVNREKKTKSIFYDCHLCVLEVKACFSLGTLILRSWKSCLWRKCFLSPIRASISWLEGNNFASFLSRQIRGWSPIWNRWQPNKFVRDVRTVEMIVKNPGRYRADLLRHRGERTFGLEPAFKFWHIPANEMVLLLLKTQKIVWLKKESWEQLLKLGWGLCERQMIRVTTFEFLPGLLESLSTFHGIFPERKSFRTQCELRIQTDHPGFKKSKRNNKKDRYMYVSFFTPKDRDWPKA